MYPPAPGVPFPPLSDMPRPATHHPSLAIDLCASTSLIRADALHLRICLYRMLEAACVAAGLTWTDLHHEDRGDGILVVAPSQVSVEVLLGPAMTWLHTLQRRHNRTSSTSAQLRIRAAITAGYLQFDGCGVVGPSLNLMYRLLEAKAFKALMTLHGLDFALITSQQVYQEIIVPGPTLLEPSAFASLPIKHKETRTTGWIWMPGTAGICTRALAPGQDPALPAAPSPAE